MRDWNTDIGIGKRKEDVFKKEFLEYLNIGYMDVTDDPESRKKDIDIIAKEMNNIDVKSLRGDKKPLTIPIEEVSVADDDKNIKRKGWFYESHADYYAFVCVKTKTMLLLKNDINFQTWYESIKDSYDPIWQCTNNGNAWYSMHRNIPVNVLSLAWYKKNSICKN